MTTLRFQNGKDFFEMAVATEDDSALPNYGDAYVTVKVQSAGFVGHNDLWVLGPAMSAFCHALVRLERSLRGEAVLESIAPDELELKVHSVTSRGHLAVEGKTGYYINGENAMYWHSVSFGLEFEPGQLSTAITLAWVKRYAG